MGIKVRIILPGGGVKGAFQAGFLYNLIETNDFNIDCIYGTSIGSILAPIVINNRSDLLKQIFESITSLHDTLDKWNFLSNYFSFIYIFFKLGKYKSVKLIDTVWNKLSVNERENANSKCKVSAWDLLNRSMSVFSGNDLYHGIKASCSLWLTVPPYKYKNNIYIDGGAGEVFPLDYIMSDSDGYDGIYILLDCSSRNLKKRNTIPKNALELMYELQSCSSELLIKENIERLKEKLGEKLLHVYPQDDIFTHNMDINKSKMLKSFIMGQKKFIDIYDAIIKNLKQ